MVKKRTAPNAPFILDYLTNEFEQPINIQWIDGKPIFRQTFDISGFTAGESQEIINGVVDQMIRVYGMVTNNAGFLVAAPYGTVADVDYAVLFSGATAGSFEFESSFNTTAGSILVCEFTKLAGGGGGG